MSALGVLSNDRSHTFRQAIESAAHVRRFAGHPDPRSLRTIHRLQTWQPDHPAASTTASNARTCSASNPGLTIRLRCRTRARSEEHTSELQSLTNLVCRLLLEKKKKINKISPTLKTVKRLQHHKIHQHINR